MITFETLKKYTELTRKDYEAYTTIGSYDYDGKLKLNFCYATNSLKDFAKTIIGIELKPNVYYWFETYGQDGELYFFERYNRNTGGSIKGHKTGWKAETFITKTIEKLSK